MLRRLTILGLVGSLLVACSSGDDTDALATSVPPATTPPVVAPVITPLSVELIVPGGEPRQVLRHQFVAGTVWSGDLGFTLTSADTSATIAGVSRLVVDTVDANGAAVVDYALEGLDVAVEAQGLDAPDAVDITGDLVVTPDRTVTSATVEVRSNGAIPGADAIASALDPRLPSLLFPFPGAPIGPGARWRITGPLSLFGADVDFTAEAELTTRSGGAFEIVVSIEMRDPVRSGVAMTGFGRIRGDTAQVGPAEGSIVLSGTLLPAGADRPQEAALDLRIVEQ